MTRLLSTSEEAEAETAAAASWYEKQRSGLGTDFLAEVNRAVVRIADGPESGSRPPGVADADVRRILVKRFPYQVVYIVLPDRIQILAVAHYRRRPGYWAERVPR